MRDKVLIFVLVFAAVQIAWFSGMYYGRWQHADTAWVLLPIACIPVVIVLVAVIGQLLDINLDKPISLPRTDTAQQQLKSMGGYVNEQRTYGDGETNKLG